MPVPTFIPVPRRTHVALRAVSLDGSAIPVIHATIDGASAGYFADSDAAIFNVSATARHPGWWPAASTSGAFRLETEESRWVTRRIEWLAAGRPDARQGARR